MIKSELYKHQYNNVMKFHMHFPKTADWSDCGVGKSLIALTKFSSLYEAGAAKRLLIASPLSVMSSWRDEINTHTNFHCTSLTGSMDQKLKKLAEGSTIYLSTYDTIAGRKGRYEIYKTLLHMFDGNNMIICDEASMIKSISASRTKALIALCDSMKYSMFLSGTFMPQNVQDVFTIYRAMDGGATFGESIYAARKYYMHNLNAGERYPKWILAPNKKVEFLNKLYIRAIRIKKEDCVDLPEKVYEKRYCYLTPQQEVHYNKMRLELHTELDNKVISSANILTKMTKLQQIVGGFLYDKDGLSHPIPTNKYGLLMEAMEQVNEDEKVVIYARFREELYNIQSILKQAGHDCVLLYGGLDEETRSNNIHKFRTDPSVKALIAQVATGGYGLTVVEANHIIYFSMTFSLTDYLQSQDRIHRIGQTKTCIYHFLLTEDPLKRIIDEYIFDSVQKNVDISSALSDPQALKKLKEELC